MEILCRLFGHWRSRKRARHIGNGQYKSKCRWCGAPMTRVAHKDWQLDDEIEATAEV